MDFSRPADYQMKTKESEKRNKNQDLAWELKTKLWSINVTVIPIIVGALGTVFKNLKKDIGGTGDQRKSRVLVKAARILKRIKET